MIRAFGMAIALLAAIATAGAEPRLLATDPAGGADGAISPDGRFILASSHRSGAPALWLYDVETQHWSQVTDGNGDDTEPSWAPDGRRAVFVSKRGGAANLWIVDVRSRALVRLTDDAEEEEYPAWSPDGRSIVYTGGPWGRRNFFVVAAEGGVPRPLLAQPGNVGACSFGADSMHVVCHTYEESWGDLIEIDLAGLQRKRLTEVSHWYYKPSESPDRRWLAFTDIGETGDRVRLMPRLSSKTTPLPAPSFSGRWPLFAKQGTELFFHRLADEGFALKLFDRVRNRVEIIDTGTWTPGRASLSRDGRLVAYCATAESESRSAVFVYDIEHRSRYRLLGDADACFPAWSPDASHIALTIRQNERSRIAVVGADGTGLRYVTPPDAAYRYLDGPIAWSPNGSLLTFAASTRPYESDVFIADLAGGEIRNVTSDSWYDEGPSFSPDGRSVVFMSTRGGNWSWGLFALDLATRAVAPVLEPGFIERRFPLQRASGELWWVETDPCLSTTFLTVRRGGEKPDVLKETAGAKWFELSADGRFLLTTATVRRTEFWAVDLSGLL